MTVVARSSKAGASVAAEKPPASRRERRRREINDRIVETARELFERHGYEATTVEDIAERADIAYGTFFNHFPTKLDLLRALAEVTLHELFDDVAEVQRNSEDFAERLVVLFETAAERAVAKGPKAREMISAMITLSFPETSVDNDRRIRTMFQTFLQEGQAASQIRSDVSLDVLTEVFVGTWYSMFLSWVHFDGYPLRDRATATGRFLADSLAPKSRP